MEPLNLKHHNQHSNFPNLKNGLVPIFPMTKTFMLRVKQLNKNISITRQQFPLTPSFCITAYKAQGKTFNKVIVDLAYPTEGKIDANYAYVALSRARKLSDIRILRNFNIKICHHKKNPDLDLEMNRLEAMNNIQSNSTV
jgi:ATP-dependent exoDNAse (exonuclease V) alpha subunit